MLGKFYKKHCFETFSLGWKFAFAEGLCSLFSQVGLYFVSQSKVDQLSRQKKKNKVELKEEMNENLIFFLHLSTQKFVL